MNFLKLAAAALLAATSTLSPAKAGGLEDLNWELSRAGVTVEHGKCQKRGLLGFYMPTKKLIGLCINNIDTEAEQEEVLRHEAVHAAQHCVHPSMAFTVNSSQYLLNNGSDQDWKFIQSAYPPEDYVIELEAFTLMRYSNSQIAEVVRNACN